MIGFIKALCFRFRTNSGFSKRITHILPYNLVTKHQTSGKLYIFGILVLRRRSLRDFSTFCLQFWVMNLNLGQNFSSIIFQDHKSVLKPLTGRNYIFFLGFPPLDLWVRRIELYLQILFRGEKLLFKMIIKSILLNQFWSNKILLTDNNYSYVM